MTTFKSEFYLFEIVGDLGLFKSTFLNEKFANGIEFVTLRLDSPRPSAPPRFAMNWMHPAVDIQSTWTPSAGYAKGLRTDWDAPFVSRAAASAPVVCLHGHGGNNRLTFAVSEVRDAVNLRAGIREETGEFACGVEFFSEPNPEIAFYEVVFRIDIRDEPYYRVLADVGDWWANLPGCLPATVPDAARRPMYSTWYSFHQNLVPDEVEAQCRLAKELGCESVIVDDGWQTLNSERGYAYCGDWEPERIPDMRGHVARVHDLGLKFLLWYSVPFVGEHSKTFSRFRDKVLAKPWGHGAHVLDPRFPEVRSYLIRIYEKAISDWNLDGFKLDFVDMFRLDQDDVREAVGGRDISSLSMAVDRLMSDVMARLSAIKPDIMIEFRQTYIGPLMRKYGNIFRASDCPNDALRNRIKTLDVRLLCGKTAVHADMIMWHPRDSVESAALQFLNILFSVPQVSVDFHRLTDSHKKMCRFWLSFWQEHRAVLLDGGLAPQRPDLLYPAVSASNESEAIVALYGQIVARLPSPLPKDIYIVNATPSTDVYLDILPASASIETRNCEGGVVSTGNRKFNGGVSALEIPCSGVAHLSFR
jgi:alpha-galactosidase